MADRENADWTGLLRRVFGFAEFRAGQEEVCRAAIAGQDLLLVMPTGAGKSLCYQLPALARGGTALVISPLIALMEDQAAKLSALGLRVARIHSGLERAVARQACADYLNGKLQFLFIAPERLRVPGFAPMLAKRRLALIAVDEAHCISQWGHDFRPDYRMLGDYLPMLRGGGSGAKAPSGLEADSARLKPCPVTELRSERAFPQPGKTRLDTELPGNGASGRDESNPEAAGNRTPVVALTATATPAVQADITKQLGMEAPARFIHGFRRKNLAIEVVEVPVPMRAGVITRLLADGARRPAIVYAQSRRQAEELAMTLSSGGLRAAAYHAGMAAETRERVQRSFQDGGLEVVVATIAFGMGIDKANIRTVIHAGLPATLEGYYQEIGRAGRDGLESRTYLMHSYADQRTHDFLLARDYPPVADLSKVYGLLGEEPRPVDELRQTSRLEEEEFDKALEKLEIHGGARVDFGGLVTAGRPDWKRTYSVQAQLRREQLDKVLRFTESDECRMAALVAHFGDLGDARFTCGKCDVCDPAGAQLRLFRRATAQERRWVQGLLDALRGVSYKTVKGLRDEAGWAESVSRKDFEELLSAMSRAGLIEVENAEFEKDGRVIPYRRISLTETGEEVTPLTPLPLLLSDGVVEELAAPAPPERRRKRKSPGTKIRTGEAAKEAKTEPAALTRKAEELAGRLREWRTVEAKRLGLPPYFVLVERTLTRVAAARPQNIKQLLEIDGMGPAKVERFGAAILGLCAGGQ